MTGAVDRALRPVQHVLVRLSRRWHATRPASRPITWVIGPAEIASLVANFARAVPGSYSVALTPHRFYDFSYDYRLDDRRGDWLIRRFAVPWLLGRLAATAHGFVYVGADGFLLDADEREWEFTFLRRHGVRVVCLFTGSDIRSPALMRRFQAETGLETIVTYLDEVAPVFATAAYDERRRRVAAVTDRYADAIFNAAVDQMSYLERATEPFPYFYPDDELLLDEGKHYAPGRRIVLHAPSSPIIKGTQVVRAAVQRLHADGLDFEYRELNGVPHAEVIAALREAHIVLNEFYAFVPGVFGVEAMANGCALLTRADETIETSLPAGSNAAWVVTTAADIAANLGRLLRDPEAIRAQARAGRAWVQEHATVSASGARVAEVLGRL